MCESPATGDLLRLIGYRMRGGCGSDLVLETVNPSRAFLTTDSGFPLSELERPCAPTGRSPWTISRPAFRSFTPLDYWQPATKAQESRASSSITSWAILRCAGLYMALSKLDSDTAEQMRQAFPSPRLKIYAHVLDFFGGMFQIRDGKAVVPGGARSEKAWADLNGGVARIRAPHSSSD